MCSENHQWQQFKQQLNETINTKFWTNTTVQYPIKPRDRVQQYLYLLATTRLELSTHHDDLDQASDQCRWLLLPGET